MGDVDRLARFGWMGFALIFGCGDDNLPGSVSGTVHGQNVAIDDAVSAVVMIPGTSGSLVPTALILMGDATELCADLTANSQPQGFLSVYIGLGVVTGSTTSAPTAPVTFTIGGSPDDGGLGVLATDATCRDVPGDDARATDGTIALTGVDGDRFTGRFDVTLDSGDHITGEFNPEPCPNLENWANSSGPLACM
jgi:hypothetical protein